MSRVRRSISIWQGIALYVGAVVGSGILILPGMTAGVAGTDALLSWAGMIVLSIPLAHTFAFMAREHPSAGGVVTFAQKAFGGKVGAIMGWFFLIAGCNALFIMPLSGGIYLVYVLHLPYDDAFLIAAVLLLAAVAANYLGLRTSGRAQLGASGVIVAVLVATIVFAMPHVQGADLALHMSSGMFVPLGQASVLIFWSFFGWEAITSLAPEFHHPQRDLTRATWGGIVIVGLLYLGVAVAVIGTHAYAAGGQTAAQAMDNASLARVMAITVGGRAALVTGLIAVVMCFGTTNVYVASISRTTYSLSRDRLAPRWLDALDRDGTPQRAVLVIGGLAVIGLGAAYLSGLSLSRLVTIPNSMGIAVYIIATAAGVRLIRPLLGRLCAVVACALCVAAYPFVGALVEIPLVTAGACLAYLYWQARRERRRPLARR